MINLFFVIHDYSGARTYANELLGWLSAQERIAVHKVYLESINYKEYTIMEEGNITSIHIPAVKRKGNSLEKYAQRCIDLMTPILQEKNHLIFHLNYNTQVKLGIKARTRFNARIIYTLHYLPNYLSSFAAETIRPEEVTTTGDVLDKEIATTADHVICVTHFAKEMLANYYSVIEIKMTVIYNGCSSITNHLYNNNSKEYVKEQLGFCTDDRILLFVGRLSPGKGVEKLIEAFTLLTDEYNSLKLVLVGKGEFDSFMELAQNNFGRISFAGKLPSEQVKQLYQIADIGVIPSEFEQCSYVALEMMQHGLPIVCSDAPGLKELFADGKSALFAPLQARTDGLLGLEISVQELYRAIKQLLDNESLARKLSQIAHANWQNHYTSAHMGQATIQVYEQLRAGTDENERRQSETIEEKEQLLNPQVPTTSQTILNFQTK